ncbi:hypothetical protein WJX72_010217 [[Myrmecia] bisecta]|uniref:RING-type domain-containing protein n=1 Tax=[Myrmecia] bisecta TaxID=41462 RepID=A0AAW1PT71_9CHLO
MRLPGPLQPVTRVAAAPDSGTAQALTQSQDDDGSYCSVCMEAWTNSGPHRICSLKCGHLFGRDCIVKWLKQKKRCPQCNKRNKLEDVRPLYVAKLTAVDVAPVEALKQEVAEERKARAKAEHDMAKAQQEVRKMAACVKKLQKENARMQMFAAGVQAATGQLGMAPHSGTWRGQLGAFAVFVRKISMLAPTAGQNVTLPTSEPGDFVRDIHFDAPKHHALLALGKQLRLFSIHVWRRALQLISYGAQRRLKPAPRQTWAVHHVGAQWGQASATSAAC